MCTTQRAVLAGFRLSRQSFETRSENVECSSDGLFWSKMTVIGPLRDPGVGSDGRIGVQTDRRQPLDTTGPDGSAGVRFY